MKKQKTGQTHHLLLEKNTSRGSSLSDEDKTKTEQFFSYLTNFGLETHSGVS